ncbi:hypothetical protein BLA23254_00334 [Burkholderia lata]|uniref:Uncharacterized protein n=2 Tax=Burkholderia lata (strain ATCC 17760 / DSM 23089 / LMG 22485 / NCIMB 9086 / R18194 / 383) TaxID=482957 RepID=A0A6P2H1E5_BURL3|nr:hypothetical protein BLA23254_00334 [Burkholderia lata]
MRSNVDLPQPELPSSANSSFFAIVRFTLSTAVLSPNFFTTFSMRTNASFGLSMSVVGRCIASGVLNESRFMMVRCKQVSESQASGATGRAVVRCWRGGIERFLVRNEWRNETGVGSRTAIGGHQSRPTGVAALAVMKIALVFIGLSARFCRLQCEFLNPSKTFWIADFRSGH